MTADTKEDEVVLCVLGWRATATLAGRSTGCVTVPSCWARWGDIQGVKAAAEHTGCQLTHWNA